MVARRAGVHIDTRAYLIGQLAVTAFQLMTHYANDYFDLAADVANRTPTRWSGGSRVLPEGELAPVVALRASLVLAGVGLMLVGLLGASNATPVLLVAGLLAWCYSAPPVRLHTRGLGELGTAVVVTGLVPLAAFELQNGATRGALLVALVPPVLLQFAMLLAIEFPDAEGDAAAGKRTLVVRLGGAWAARLYAAATVMPFVALPLLVEFGLPPTVALVAPLAVWRAWVVLRGGWREPGRWEGITFWAVALLTVTGIAELAGYWISR